MPLVTLEPLAISQHTSRHGLRSPLLIALCVSLWLASVGNIALWRTLFQLPAMQGNMLHSVWFAISFGVLIAAVLMLLLSLLAWRYTIKPAAIVLLLMAAAGMHFMLLYRIVINPEMMTNVLQTDVRESRDLLNPRLLFTLLLVGIVPAILVWRVRIRPMRNVARHILHNLGAAAAALVILVVVLLLNYQTLAGLMRTEKQLRYLINPLNSVYALVRVGLVQPFIKPMPFEVVGQDAYLAAPATADDKPPLFVLVVGETARAGNFSLNGYPRNTNPQLAQDGVVSYRNVWACGTSTAASLPCMFSPLDKNAFTSRTANTSNLLDVLQQAGLAVLWLDNQSGCKGVCARVPTIDTSTTPNGSSTICKPGGECLDEIMLHDLDERMAALPADTRARGIVIVLHQMGSHGPAYYNRSDASSKHFTPECTTNVLQDCPHDALINAYDNSIVYTDRFLHLTIEWLRQHGTTHRTAMLYLSDHGESLGENNLYLHGLPYSIAPDVQKRIPLLWWLSPDWQQYTGITHNCLAQQRDSHYSHDHLFHSVLGAMGVRTQLYQPELDMLAVCRPAGNTS